MPVPSAITALSQTPGSNSPPGTENPTTADDYLRTYAAFIAGLRDGVGFTNPVILASAATTEIGAQNSMFVDISGITTITSFGTTYRGPRFLRFTGAMLLTHNATALNLIGGANITTVAGDTAMAVPNQALTGWNVVEYTRGSALAALAGPLANSGITGAAIAGPLATSGITGAAALSGDSTQAFNASTINAAPILHLNDIVNGDFRIAQAGTSFAAPATGAYDLDGWVNGNSSAAVFTAAQVAGSTAGRLARQVTITTADAAVAAGDFVADVTKIEGSNIEKYVGNTFTLAFRARVPVAGIHCVALRNTAGDRSYIAEINFPTANVYQNCSFTVVGGLPTAGTWNYTNGVGLDISFSHMVGTTFQTTPNAWQTGNFLGTANQVNDCATVGNVWAMEKVTMTLGTVAAVSEIDVGDELRRCQRYRPVKKGGANSIFGTGAGFDANSTRLHMIFPTTARIAPTGFVVSTASDFNFTSGSGGDVVFTGFAFQAASDTGCFMTGTHVGGGAANLFYLIKAATANARIIFTGAEL